MMCNPSRTQRNTRKRIWKRLRGAQIRAQTKLVLVTGATGQQGGAVARSLLRQEQRVRILTRNPIKAGALVRANAEVGKGDITDLASLQADMRGVEGVFAMPTPFEAGMEAEVRQGTLLADVAKQAGVAHYVYTSVAGADRNTSLPHFETKWKVEQHIRRIGIPATGLRPVAFMENFGTIFKPSAEGVLSLPMRPETKLQMIALQDIGEFGMAAFVCSQDFLGQTIELAGDELTMTAITTLLARRAGHPIRSQGFPDDQVQAAMGDDLALMFRWLIEVGYSVNIPALHQQYGSPLTKFADLIATADWARG